MPWKEIAIFFGAPILRSVFGWAQNSLKDKKIKPYEWKKLAETVIRVTLIQAAATATVQGYLQVIGTEPTVAIAAATAGATLLLDKLFKALKENRNVRPRT